MNRLLGAIRDFFGAMFSTDWHYREVVAKMPKVFDPEKLSYRR